MLFLEFGPSIDVEVIYNKFHKTIKLIHENLIHHPGKSANGIF
jgi:hypothetical protein